MCLTTFRTLVASGEISLQRKSKGKKGKSPKADSASNSPKPSKRSKYNAKKVSVLGVIFDSKVESERYVFLAHAQKKGEIKNLEMQKKFNIVVNEVLICTYIADFCYTVVSSGAYIVEDVKGFKTPIYNLKKKLMKAALGLDIKEVLKEGITKLSF